MLRRVCELQGLCLPFNVSFIIENPLSLEAHWNFYELLQKGWVAFFFFSLKNQYCVLITFVGVFKVASVFHFSFVTSFYRIWQGILLD